MDITVERQEFTGPCAEFEGYKLYKCPDLIFVNKNTGSQEFCVTPALPENPEEAARVFTSLIQVLGHNIVLNLKINGGLKVFHNEIRGSRVPASLVFATITSEEIGKGSYR